MVVVRVFREVLEKILERQKLEDEEICVLGWGLNFILNNNGKDIRFLERIFFKQNGEWFERGVK